MNSATPSFKWRDDADGVYGFVLRAAGSAYTPQNAPKPGWYFKIHRLDGSDWYNPLPSAFEVESRYIRYRPEVQSLQEWRAVAMRAFERYSAHLAGAGRKSVRPEFLSVVALQEARVAEQYRTAQSRKTTPAAMTAPMTVTP
jgi:hypothetical protein